MRSFDFEGRVGRLARRLLLRASSETGVSVDARDLGKLEDAIEVCLTTDTSGHPVDDEFFPAEDRLDVLNKLRRAVGSREVQALDEAQCGQLPSYFKALAARVDGLWGRADGRVEQDEIDRAGLFLLAAARFYRDQGELLLDLAEQLGLHESRVMTSLDAKLQALNGERRPSPAKIIRLCRRTGWSYPKARAELEKELQPPIDRRWARNIFEDVLASTDIPGLPELLREARTHSRKWHQFGVLHHIAVGVHNVEILAAAVGIDFTSAPDIMLLHDIGKMLSRELKPAKRRDAVFQEEGTKSFKYSFHGHEDRGADRLAELGVDEYFVFHVRHHGTLRYITADDPEDRRRALPFFRDVLPELSASADRPFRDHGRTGRELLREMVIIYVADQMAKGDQPDVVRQFEIGFESEILPFVRDPFGFDEEGNRVPSDPPAAPLFSDEEIETLRTAIEELRSYWSEVTEGLAL